MKKLCGSLILCLMLLALPAMAETQEEWNDGSAWRLNGEASVWNLASDAAAGRDAVMTLPKGTWVRVVVQDGEWTVIDYYAGGSVHSGAIRSGLVYPADGNATAAPTVSPTPIPMATAMPTIAAPTAAPTLPSMLELATEEGEPTPAPTAEEPDTVQEDFIVTALVDGQEVTGSVLSLGCHTCLLQTAEGQTEVPTNAVTCSSQVAAGHQIAAITAPKNGAATLRATGSGNGTALGKVKDGKLVCVLAEQNGYCKIWTDGKTGYVLASAMDFNVYVASPLGTGTLKTSGGKTTGDSTVNIRVAAKKTSTKSAEWTVGTQVTVLSKTKDWYLVEYEGQRGYVNSSFLKMN